MMQLTLQHQARELLHAIELLVCCMRIPGATDADRRAWWREIRIARVKLGALYAAGLSRDFRTQPALNNRAKTA